MHFLKRYYLPITVFITGACVLVIEVVATRILAPYFGNTMFTVSSVLGVVLAALSFGYYLGGRLADRRPQTRLFFGLILVSGLSVFVLHWMQVMFLSSLGSVLPLTTGPLIASALLFFLPAFILGTLSPFAIKLQDVQNKKQGIGSIAGEMFFFSTFGSIFGSLIAGYVLIPNLGVDVIVVSTGVVLAALGLVPLVLLGMNKKLTVKIGVVVVTMVLLSVVGKPMVEATVYSKNGMYEKITINDAEYNGRPARFLFQDRSTSGGMFLDSDTDMVFNYSKYYALHEVFTPTLKNTLVIGGGAYTIPKALLQTDPDVRVDVAEIEPSLVGLSKKYFNVPDSPRLHHYIEDGRRLLHDVPHRYDMIFSDVYYSLYSIPMHFTTQEFFRAAYDKLNDDGIFVANIIGSLEDRSPSLIRSELKTIKTVFPNAYLFAVESPHSNEVQNIILVGHKNKQKRTFDSAVLQQSKYEVVQTLAEKQVDLANFSVDDHQLLTDNFAPVESWTAHLLRRHVR